MVSVIFELPSRLPWLTYDQLGSILNAPEKSVRNAFFRTRASGKFEDSDLRLRRITARDGRIRNVAFLSWRAVLVTVSELSGARFGALLGWVSQVCVDLSTVERGRKSYRLVDYDR